MSQPQISRTSSALPNEYQEAYGASRDEYGRDSTGKLCSLIARLQQMWVSETMTQVTTRELVVMSKE